MGEGLVSRDSDKAPCVFETYDDIESEAGARFIQATADKAGERLDVFAARASGETRAFMQRLIGTGSVCVNGEERRANARLRLGDSVEIRIEAPAQTALIPEDIPLSIVYQDADIAVIDKPKGMVVHPAPGNERGTLVNAILFHIRDLSGIGGELRPGIVHRIDKMTSGLIVIAKNDFAHRALAEQMKSHAAGRVYLAIVDGNIREDFGTVNAPIGRHPVDRKRMAVVPNGREAITHWHVLERYGTYTLIAVRLETGRTHQIRVHMAYCKHPVSGDAVYGGEKNRLGLEGQALHAVRLLLAHPRTGEQMAFEAPVPEYFTAALRRAGRDAAQPLEVTLQEGIERLLHERF
ncbi:MAG: RNA pseudouridine synthase [Clostridia bacterium]|nr:MAG: RNA pseudouridine synthase [Clostridia bacterium]